MRLQRVDLPAELGDLLEVARQDLGALVERLVRRDRAVGPDLQHQALVGRHRADARALDHVVDAADRREDGVDRDGPDIHVLARSIGA